MTEPATSPETRGRLGDGVRFLKSWIQRPMQIGAVQPSGRALARMMASHADPAASGPVIEIGPGTGPVTAALLERGVTPERMVLVEYSPQFCALLRKRFPRVHIVEGDAYGLSETLRHLSLPLVSAVVSSLPLLTRPVAQRCELLRQAFSMSLATAPFIQFTYGATAPIPAGDGYATSGSRRVWLNVPPARVWVYRRTP